MDKEELQQQFDVFNYDSTVAFGQMLDGQFLLSLHESESVQELYVEVAAVATMTRASSMPWGGPGWHQAAVPRESGRCLSPPGNCARTRVCLAARSLSLHGIACLDNVASGQEIAPGP